MTNDTQTLIAEDEEVARGTRVVNLVGLLASTAPFRATGRALESVERRLFPRYRREWRP